MKKQLTLFIALCIITTLAQGQVNIFDAYQQEKPIGDYEFTDCNTGVKRSTYDPLNEGKVLYVAKMATWCPYCKNNTKANFNKDTVASLLTKYKDKLEVWLMFDGPTDCNGAKSTQEVVNLKGANVHLFVDNNDVGSKFYSAGVPTITVIDPKTKRSVFQNWESSSSFPLATKTMDDLLNNKYTFPSFINTENIAQFKPAKVSSTRENNFVAWNAKYIVDGKLGTSWSSLSDKAQDSWCMIDLEQTYLITYVKMLIGTGMDSKLVKLQLSENENGPWKDISDIKPFNTQLNFKIPANSKGRYLRILNASANPGFVLSVVDLVVKGTPENPMATDQQADTDGLTIYPNPAKDFVTINPATENSKVIITNSYGINVLEVELVKGKNNINIQSLNKGVYFVSIKGESTQPTKLLID